MLRHSSQASGSASVSASVQHPLNVRRKNTYPGLRYPTLLLGEAYGFELEPWPFLACGKYFANNGLLSCLEEVWMWVQFLRHRITRSNLKRRSLNLQILQEEGETQAGWCRLRDNWPPVCVCGSSGSSFQNTVGDLCAPFLSIKCVWNFTRSRRMMVCTWKATSPWTAFKSLI